MMVWNGFKSSTIKKFLTNTSVRLPWWLSSEESACSAGDVGSVPWSGRSHMPWSDQGLAPQLLSLCSRVWESQLLSPHATKREAHMPYSLCSTRQTSIMRSAHTVLSRRHSAGTAGDLGLLPGWGRSTGGGNGTPLQYSCLEILHTLKGVFC